MAAKRGVNIFAEILSVLAHKTQRVTKTLGGLPQLTEIFGE